MAKLIIRMKDNQRQNQPNPHLAYRPGDIVDVLPDDGDPGSGTTEPDWLIVDYPDIPVERFARFCAPEWSQEQDVPWNDLEREEKGDAEVRQMVTRRLYKFDRDSLTVQNELDIKARRPERFIVDNLIGDITRDRMDELLLNKRTGQTAKDEGRRV